MFKIDEEDIMNKRPLSPHLQIYKWQFTMLTSICHRASGIILSGTILLLIASFEFILYGKNLVIFLEWASSPMGKAILMVITLSFCYHLLNGIRHLFWDAGKGFELATAQKSAYYVFFGTIILSLLIFAVGYGII